jgi:putative hydrolase
MGGALGRGAAPPPPAEASEDDAGMAMFGNLMGLLAPMMLGMSAGSMVGHLALRSFGQYDLPIPRPPSSEIRVVAATIDRFAADWSLPVEDLRLWVCLQELATHAVLGVPHVRAELESLLTRYVAGFRPNPDALGDKLATLDPTDPAGGVGDFQRVLGDPEVLLGAMQSDEQRDLLPRIDGLVAVVIGYVDHVVDTTARSLLGDAGRVSEAVRRRRVESDQSDVFVERLLGLTLTQAAVERGQAFVAGVLERDGDLARLWRSARELPTPAEVDAPGLWLARIDLPE